MDLASGHLFVGSEGSRMERGGAILVHKKWKKGLKSFLAKSERLCALDIDAAGVALLLVCVCIPHAGFEDAALEEVYAALSELPAGGKEKKRKLLAAGDFTAVLGHRRDEFGEDPRVIGVHGVGGRNARDNVMVQWATAEGLCLSMNTVPRALCSALDT